MGMVCGVDYLRQAVGHLPQPPSPTLTDQDVEDREKMERQPNELMIECADIFYIQIWRWMNPLWPSLYHVMDCLVNGLLPNMVENKIYVALFSYIL